MSTRIKPLSISEINRINMRNLKIMMAVRELYKIDKEYIVIERQQVPPNDKVRRVDIYEEIIENCDLVYSPQLYGVIGTILKSLGAKTINSHGTEFFINITTNKDTYILPDVSLNDAGEQMEQ